MNQDQAEKKATIFNSLVKHPRLSYSAGKLQPTKWEKERYGVFLHYQGSEDVGIAMT